MFSMKKGVKSIKTSHTLNKVPFVIVDSSNSGKYTMTEGGGLSNVAATICNLLGYEKPSDFDDSLIKYLGG
jgi:2,3-bisphosphoglycerate-independent phosphoglycerate mutase